MDETATQHRDSPSRLRPEKLHVRLTGGVLPAGPVTPRRYTLTHSDATGDLYLTVGLEYDEAQISGWYTRFMRDEVLAEWRDGEHGPKLHVHCHVSGGVVLGSAGWRDQIFRHELPLVLEALRHGDRALYAAYPHLDHAPILVHFHASQSRYRRVEQWGTPELHRPSRSTGSANSERS
jgi:hypothetical protein